MSQRGVYSRTNIDGQNRWYVRIVVNGKQRRFAPHGGFEKKRDAIDFLTRAKADISRGIFFPDQFNNDPIPLKELLKDQGLRLAKTANSKNNRQYESWWITQLGALDTRAITPAILDQAMATLRDDQLSPQTIHHYMKFLRHRLNLAKRDDLIDRSPFDKIQLKQPKNERIRFYSEEERQALYTSLGPDWREAAELAGQSGLRWSEQFKLTRAQIHLKEGFLDLPTTKAGEPQVRILNSRAKELIKKQLDRHQSKWLYPSERGDTPINYKNFHSRVWSKAIKAAGITNGRWNDWRHTFATDLTQTGQDTRVIADLLGHTTLQMVKRYAHMTSPHLRQAVESVANKQPTNQPTDPHSKHK